MVSSQSLNVLCPLPYAEYLLKQTTTYLAFQYDANLHTHRTIIKAIQPVESLHEDNRSLFKSSTPTDYVVVTASTIFHPQGGGQPSDTGSICNTGGVKFEVLSVRMDAVTDGQVLHFGRFVPANLDPSTPPSAPPPGFLVGEDVDQAIDVDARALYSRLHTAGHVLGAAVRHLLQDKIPGFDELKASHFPQQAACEFQGIIEGKWKSGIQEKVDSYIEKGMPVEIEWCDEEDFAKEGLQRLLPEKRPVDGGKWRIVRIVGAECYPCGGTHVQTTNLCGKTTVKKISRSKGTSRVSYSVV